MKYDRRVAARKEAELQKALRRTEREKEVEKALAADRAFAMASENAKHKADTVTGLEHYGAPKQVKVIVNANVLPAARIMLAFPNHVRPLHEWKPNGKSRQAILRSLTQHIFSRYKAPQFLLDVFAFDVSLPARFDETRMFYPRQVMEIAVRILRGESLFAAVKAGDFPVPLTRQMCHDFLTKTTVDEGFVVGMRLAQMRGARLDRRFIVPWMEHQGPQIFSRPAEEFWYSVMQWFGNVGMFDLTQVGPLLDYIAAQYDANRGFSMKGRTAMALMRDRDAWHQNFSKVRKARGDTYDPCGLKVLDFEDKNEHWTIEELLSDKALLDEGNHMHHCVYSYGHNVQRGFVSIWSMRLNGERRVTIEVDNNTRRIRQARQQYNRPITGAEHKILSMWAGSNGLTIASLI